MDKELLRELISHAAESFAKALQNQMVPAVTASGVSPGAIELLADAMTKGSLTGDEFGIGAGLQEIAEALNNISGSISDLARAVEGLDNE